MAYQVRTATFEGPLDTLLELIEKRKFLINDVSLTSVADDYISYVKNMPELPIGETAEFVALAATLLLIKSRSLLPSLELTEGEESDIDDLKRRLALLELMRKAGKELGPLFGRTRLVPHRGVELPPLFLPDESATPDSLLQALRNLLFSFPKALTLPETSVKKIISIEEMIERLVARVERGLSLSFREMSGAGAAPKQETIVAFLALLELVKQGIIRATQSEDFGDITLESDRVGVPSYE